jgi:hypothetical protein
MDIEESMGVAERDIIPKSQEIAMAAVGGPIV